MREVYHPGKSRGYGMNVVIRYATARMRATTAMAIASAFAANRSNFLVIVMGKR